MGNDILKRSFISFMLESLGFSFPRLLPIGCILLPVLLGVLAALAALVLLGGSVFACFGGVLGLAAIDSAYSEVASVEVTGHDWKRSIGVEKLKRTKDEDWCEDIPDDADVSWSESRQNKKKGFGKRRRNIYKEWCSYSTIRWVTVDWKTNEGEGLSPAPTWPTAPDDDCSTLGCVRPGTRTSTLNVYFRKLPKPDADTSPWKCKVDDVDEWSSWKVGDQTSLTIGGLGIPQCTSLERRGSGAEASPPTDAPEEE